MKLLIAGINHFDVLGQKRLLNWLKNKSDEFPSDPGFVAVEWDKNNLAKIKAQQPLIGELARSEWPEAPDSFIQIIQQSLGYDGDTHKYVLPSVETLWLDNGRTIADATEYTRERMNMYKGWVKKTCLDFSENILLEMSLNAWDASTPPKNGGDERDIIFTNIINSRIKKAKLEWAIIIVGANHASLSEGCMASRLREQGIVCLPEELRLN